MVDKNIEKRYYKKIETVFQAESQEMTNPEKCKLPVEKVIRFLAIHVVLAILAVKVGMYAFNFHQAWFYSNPARLEYLIESRSRWDNPKTTFQRARGQAYTGSVLIGMVSGSVIFFGLSLIVRTFFHWDSIPEEFGNSP